MKLIGITFVSTLALLGSIGCGNSDTQSGNSSSAGSTGTCQKTCFECCYDQTQNQIGCVQACRDEATGGTGGTTTGSGGTGNTSAGGTGNTSSGGTGAVVSTGGAGGTGTSTGGTGTVGTGGATGGTGGTSTTHQTITLTMDPFTAQPGVDTYACQNFANPAGSNELVFVESESFMSPGSHHMFLMEGGTNTNGALETEQSNPSGCNGLQFSTMIHSAQTPQVTMKYPPGVGAKVTAGAGLRFVAHYYNTTGSPLTAQVSVVLYVANPGEVSQLAGFLFGNIAFINVPAGQTGTAHATWSMPQNMQMIFFVSHMHSHATNFVSTLGGQPLYQTTEWDAPTPVAFDPMLNVTAGQILDWTCTYDNTMGTQALTFGESAKTNEMCIVNARVVTPGGNPVTKTF